MDNGCTKINKGNFPAGKRVMIVDDVAVMRTIIKEIISKHDYEVAGEFENGKLAAEFYNENSSQIDYVILDICMPVMGGIDFLQNIQKNNMCKMVVVSALGQTPVIVDAIKHGTDYFLVKPFSPEKLIDVLSCTYDSYFSISNLDRYITLCNAMNCFDGEVLSQGEIDKIQQLDDSIEGRTESERVRINRILAQPQADFIMNRKQCLDCGNRTGESCQYWQKHFNLYSDLNCSRFLSITEVEERKRKMVEESRELDRQLENLLAIND